LRCERRGLSSGKRTKAKRRADDNRCDSFTHIGFSFARSDKAEVILASQPGGYRSSRALFSRPGFSRSASSARM